MNDIAIRFEHVWKSYPSYYHVNGGIKNFIFHLSDAVQELKQRRSALEDMNFTIHKGESFGFIGRNGAGKSTTLGMIAGVLMPDRGTITVNGRISPLLELGAGFHPEMTGRENIFLNGVLMGLTKNEIREHVDDIIEFSELSSFIDQPVRTYSSGMFSKLGFAVVAHLKPEILLLDEILSVGDIAFAKKCETKFWEFHENPDVTIVLVSHGLENVAAVCDRAAWVENKTVKMLGPAKDIVKEYVDANTPKIAVPGSVVPLPPHVWTGTPIVDCSMGQAIFGLHASWGEKDEVLFRLSLLEEEGGLPVQEWQCRQGVFSMEISDGVWTLSCQQGEESVLVEALHAEKICFNPKKLHLLRIIGEGGGQQSPPIWLAAFTSVDARRTWSRHRAAILNRYGTAEMEEAPLWPEGKMLRVIARNLVTRDAVGNFALGVAGLATRAGLPARLYAFVSCPELAGIVSPIGDLKAETRPQDTLFYNWSIEDEFLPGIVVQDCRKVLYYHNVTPGKWFREYNAAFADRLDRSREQFDFFGAFDSVLANSAFSLHEIEPYLKKNTPVKICPPTIDPLRLSRVTPEFVELPEADKLWLWVGRMAPHKQPEKAIELFSSHLESSPQDLLVMVGGGRTDFPAYSAQIQKSIEAMSEQARSRIVFLSGLSDGQLAWLYRHGNLLLCTSGHEGFCLPVMEARMFGLNVQTLPQEAVDETRAAEKENFFCAERLLGSL